MLGVVFGAVVGAVVLAVALAARVARVRALRRRYEGAAVVADACPCAPLSWTLWRLLRAGLGDGVRFPRAATGVGADGPTPFVLDLGAAEAVVLPADKLPAPRALLPRRVADALVWRPPAAQPPSPPPPPAVYTPTATGTHATSRDAIACAGAPALLRANSTVALATLMCSATFVRALGHAAARTVSAWTRQHDVPLFDACQQYVVDALLAVFIGEQALAESCGAARARLARQVCRAARALRPSAWSACSPLRTCTRADAGERTHVRRIAALVAAVMRASGGPHAPSAYAEHAATIAASSSDTDASERPQTLAFAAMLLRACEDAARLTAWVVFQLLNTERNAYAPRHAPPCSPPPRRRLAHERATLVRMCAQVDGLGRGAVDLGRARPGGRDFARRHAGDALRRIHRAVLRARIRVPRADLRDLRAIGTRCARVHGNERAEAAT